MVVVVSGISVVTAELKKHLKHLIKHIYVTDENKQ